MRRALFLCNSVYQVLVALWIKHSLLCDDDADIIISDHMNNGFEIKNRIKEYSSFSNAFYVKSFAFARGKVDLSNREKRELKIHPNTFIKNYIKLEHQYTELYAASLDPFTQLLFGYIKTNNKDACVILYEDGMYTYSKLMEEDYLNTRIPVDDFSHRFIHKYIYHRNYIYGNVHRMFLFNPQYISWNPDFNILNIPKIDCNDYVFRTCCNRIFGYDDNTDCYDRKYIFMEESFYAEGTPINDLELLNELANKVGKENIMVKIHPRNPENRFKLDGFKTNTNTAIPWELIILNNDDLCEKTLITISSSSVLNPILIFGKKIKTYSLHKLVIEGAKSSRLLSSEFWELTKRLFENNSDTITICNSIEEIE